MPFEAIEALEKTETTVRNMLSEAAAAANSVLPSPGRRASGRWRKRSKKRTGNWLS